MTNSRAPARIIPHAFPGITPSEVSELISSSKLMNYPAGAILCHENALENTFYLILEGRVEVTKVINTRETRMLKTLGAGDFFGEMALIHNSPRTATVKAITPLIALEIDKASFDRVLKNSSSVSLAMVREISRRLRENDTLAIDDLRMRASELAEAYQKLAEQEVARKEFITNVSHQLRTPLQAAGGYLQMLQKGAFPAEKVPDIMKTVTRNVEQITGLVNDMLFVQEMEMILEQFKGVDLLDLTKQVVRGYEAKCQTRQIAVKIESELKLPPAAGDRQSLERALTALVDNAIKYSRDEGEVEISLFHKDDQVAVGICDHGVGIPPENMAHIFDRFYHVDQSGDVLYEGLGLGLAIARQVIDQHKGRVEVVSAPGEGSTFTVWLNVWRESRAASENVVTIPRSAAQSI
jgi:two-component system phosphate regulon sensor histidine kinase PhoR